MLFQYMQDGGPLIMWPIAGLSVIATLFILERTSFWIRYAMRRDAVLRRDVMDGRPTADMRLMQSLDPVALAARWFRIDPDRGRLMADRAMAEGRRSIALLESIAGLSISLGLFGTVLGVSMSFDSMSGGKSDEVAHGLAVALYTTVAGLINYIVCFAAAALFRHFSDGLEEEMAIAEHTVRSLESQSASPPAVQAQAVAGGAA